MVRLITQKKYLITIFLLLIFTALGAILRFSYLAKSDFPLNDGGMFYTMVQDLQANHYQLPALTSYNFSRIPFAYPPLSFYTIGILNQFLAIDLLTLFRIYPVFFNLISIPLFYFLAKEVTGNNKLRSFIATAFYAILLPSYEWLITGGGATRSPAQTLFISALTFYLLHLRTSKRRYFFISVFLAAWMTYHHLEYTWLIFISIFLFSYQKGMVIKNVFAIAIYSILLVLLVSPYWLTIFSHHGLSPFISAFTSGDFNLFASLSRLVTLVFTEEFLSNYINILAIIGIFFSFFALNNKKIPLWLVLITILDNRSAFRSLIFPVAILAAIGVDQILGAIKAGYSSTINSLLENEVKRKMDALTIIFLGFSILYPFFLGILNTTFEHQVLTSLKKPEIQAMEWVKENTDPDSQFVVINSSESWIIDRNSEWFPALAQRKSIATVQGKEWFPNLEYQKNKKLHDELHNCILSTKNCPDLWVNSDQKVMKYFFMSKTICYQNTDGCQQRLELLFGNSSRYVLVYENEGVAVIQVEK